jgi:ornithine--oxo-acid transaminase
MIDPQPDLPDMVFTANAGLAIGESFVPASMKHVERRGERAHFEAWFSRAGWQIEAVDPVAFQEGAGDALPFGGTLVAGHRVRSEPEGYRELSERLGLRVLPVELTDSRYYHLDLAFCPLGPGRAMIVPSALGRDSVEELLRLVDEPLLLLPAEGLRFCANSVLVGSTVIMPDCTARLRRALERWGLEVVVVDVSEFLKAGGAVRCLTLALDVPTAEVSESSDGNDLEVIRLTESHGARNYKPLPVVINRARGVWMYDGSGRAYLDALSAYSALNFGHRHPALIAAARRQLDRVTLTSRAFQNDQLGPWCRELAQLCGKELVLPMNTGAEAVETAIKVARKWGYRVKEIPDGTAKIVVCEGNFHGRTTTVISFSSDPLARAEFGPYTPGFLRVPYGDIEALRLTLSDEAVVAFLVEPVQGEAGVVLPPDGYLREARELCTERGVLLIADEIQSGLGRTGRTFACDHEHVEPDIYVLGKALGGGIMPLSAIVADDHVLGVLRPGEHGSTFGGNPLACAVGREVLRLLATGEIQERSEQLGAQLRRDLDSLDLPLVTTIRSRGLWFGIDLYDDAPSGRAMCEQLLRRRVLCKETHDRTLRLSPPLIIEEPELEFLLGALAETLRDAPILN